MGWSACAVACFVLEEIVKELKSQNQQDDSSNTWYTPLGHWCFYERGREHDDGRITGIVDKWESKDGKYIGRSGFHIAKDGKIIQFPTSSKQQRLAAESKALAEMIRTFGSNQAANDCSPRLGR